MVSQQLLDELKIILEEEYKLELTPDIVSEIGNTLVQFFTLLIRIDQEKLEEEENAR